jgi:hypothetical protein
MARTKQVQRSKSPMHSTKAKLQATQAGGAASKAKAAVTPATTKRRKNVDEDTDGEEVTKVVKKAKKDLKLDEVLVTYSIDDTMPELKEMYNNRSTSILLSELLDINSDVQKSDVS